MSAPVQTLLGAGAVVAAILLMWGAGSRLAAAFRRINHFLDDWSGEEARPGVPAQPGVIARLADHSQRIAKVEERTNQLIPNGGSHLADQVSRIEQQMKDAPSADTLARIEAQLNVLTGQTNSLPSADDLDPPRK
jgi:hypothetical protein